jgi:ABC-type multidrug transport system ATPase subunit/pSer/pThr/pTyr-binding forkhead associated (FHA) protein/ABC-type multidrug transport system permease subunit
MIDIGRPRTIIIGRDESCTFRIDRPTVSKQHALLEFLPGNKFLIQDLNSANGVSVNSLTNRLPEGSFEVGLEDRLFLGRTEVQVRDILIKTAGSGQAQKGKVETATIKMRGASMVLGRDPKADFQISHPMVSARHARLSREGNQYFIEDLDSTNGTFVRGRRLAPNIKVPIKVGDEIGFGSYTFSFNELGYVVASTGNEIPLTAENLAVFVPGDSGMRELLGQVSLTIESGDLVALMGPSGAGKTTFMCALNGIIQPSGGRVLYRNLDLADNFGLFRTMIGYVPQDDIMHAQLTVYKALYYTAKLRLPIDFSESEIDERIRSVVADVGLTEKIDDLIGDAVKKTLSGGQRKRVNLAMELLSEPWVLFLDEPTSGLSSLDARTVIELLRKIADNGRTVIVTIHQPSIDVYNQFNLLAMISNHPPKKDAPRVPGRLVYFGPAMDAFQFFCPRDKSTSSNDSRRPEEIEAGLLRKPVDEWVKRYNESSYKKMYVGDRKKTTDQAKPGVLPQPRKDRFRQLKVLCQRLAELKIRDTPQLAIALALPAVFALLVALSCKATWSATTDPSKYYGNFLDFSSFSKKIGTAHFLMVVAAVWFGCNNAIREVVGERAIYRRERLVNLSLSSYFLSKYVVLGFLALFQCVMMLSIVYESLGLHSSYFQVLLTLWITAITGTGIGLCISSIAQSNEQAIAFLPLALLPMIVLGGCLTTVKEMRDHPPLGWLSGLAPTRWAFEANYVLENDAQGSAATFANANSPPAQLMTLQQNLEQATAEARASEAKLEEIETRAARSQAAAEKALSGVYGGQVLPPGLAHGLSSNFAATSFAQDGLSATVKHNIDQHSKSPQPAIQGAAQAGNNSSKQPGSASSGYTDIADSLFPRDDSTPRHTWTEALSRLTAMAAFWAMTTLAMLKKDEWEWWRHLATSLKLK